MRTSLSGMSISILSSITGKTPTEAKLVCRRALESKGEMRTSRCTPDSGLQPAIGVLALDQNRRRFDAGLFALALFEIIDLVAATLRPARIHAQQHLGPILALGAARARHGFRDRRRSHPLRPRAWIRASWLRRASVSREASLPHRPPSPCRSRPRPFRSGRRNRSARSPARGIPTAPGRAGCVRASDFALPARRSRRRGIRIWRSAHRGGGRICPSQRCLLSRASACLISSMVRSVSARMSGAAPFGVCD